ncbi:hypothetical protein [Spirulina sp. 06S082]|nr:hypothetical protein [Spirulina sp. 06S082]MEA5469781.1 hypothetical protein [Spirulina sp. 06S082]
METKFHHDGERFIEFVEAIEQRDRERAEKDRELVIKNYSKSFSG